MLILSTPEEINQISPVPQSLIIDHPDYLKWYDSIRLIYGQLVFDNPKFEYRSYQAKYAAMGCIRRKNLLAHAQGVGKTTLTALMIAALYRSEMKSFRSDKSTYGMVERTAQIHIAVPNVLAATRWLEDLGAVEMLRGSFEYIKTEQDLLTTICPIIIYRHDFPKLKAKSRAHTTRPYISRLLAKQFRPNFLVIDEIHELSNPKTDRYRHLDYLRHRAKRILGLSGTLADGRLDQLHTICQFVYGRDWDYHNDRAGFVKRFSKKVESKSHYLTGTEETEEDRRYLESLNWDQIESYYQLMRRFVHRLTLDEPEVRSCITLPEPVTIPVYVEPSDEQRARYQSYMNEHLALLKIAARSSGSDRYRTLNLIHPLIQASHSHPDNEIIPKAQTLIDLVQKHNKVAVFVSGIETSRYITGLLKTALGEERVVRLYAQDPEATPVKMNDEARINAVYQFQYNPEIQVGVFSLNLAAVSIDLTSTNCLIHYETGWSSLKIMQSISRAIRPGNRNKTVPHYYLINRCLIDEHQYTLLQQKLMSSKMLLDYQDSEIETEDRAGVSGDLNPINALAGLLENCK
ncbi:helicase-related protein [Leptolyngbya sp. AN03gr2]|uniref:helicase-related protein n=1 Tax=Leptolyngbya sp. AN03gr2 TaxID=3423364 RepID=UPI003D3203A2